MKKLPIGLQDFKDLIEHHYLYIDKTRDLVSLAESHVPVFLSRPRRFGKSLIVSTFRELFLGNKELFQNTYAYDHWDFNTRYPVLSLDMSTVVGETSQDLNQALLRVVKKLARQHSMPIRDEKKAAYAFDDLIGDMGEKSKIIVLIDEYDTPILDNIYNKELPQLKKTLREFYKILKANSANIRFLFVTGISKFSQVSIFSALNHLNDISLQRRYGAIAGYTYQEIKTNFPQQIEIVKKRFDLSEQVFWEKLQHYYNGYSWDGETFVYNPLSILKYFNTEGEFHPYWMETGSPSFIVNYSKDKRFNITDFEQIQVTPTFLNRHDIDEDSPQSFLTQAGYLTIKGVDDGEYTLDFPNQEVRHSFCELILNVQYSVSDSDLLGVKRNLKEALKRGQVEQVIAQFKVIYSSIPYIHFDSNRTEHFYSAVLLMYLQAAGFETHPERLSNKGRLDLSLHYEKTVYIFELKVDDSPKKAIEQIIKNNYAGAYTNKLVVIIGIQVDFGERNIIAHEAQAL